MHAESEQIQKNLAAKDKSSPTMAAPGLSIVISYYNPVYGKDIHLQDLNCKVVVLLTKVKNYI